MVWVTLFIVYVAGVVERDRLVGRCITQEGVADVEVLKGGSDWKVTCKKEKPKA